MPTPEEKLSLINQSPVIATWRPKPTKFFTGPNVSLNLTNESHFSLNTFTKYQGVVDIGILYVSPDLRGNGIGKRLTRSLGAVAQLHNYRDLMGPVVSEHALDIFGDVFGQDRIDIHGSGFIWSPTPDRSFEEAREILVEFGKREVDPEHRIQQVNVHVDLDGLDIADAEIPVEEYAEGFRPESI
jgi:GNAT superfamily N-acetyltransferase